MTSTTAYGVLLGATIVVGLGCVWLAGHLEARRNAAKRNAHRDIDRAARRARLNIDQELYGSGKAIR